VSREVALDLNRRDAAPGGVSPIPKKALKTYPFELSGGLRQRAMIAMGIGLPPRRAADRRRANPPALDVTIQGADS